YAAILAFFVVSLIALSLPANSAHIPIGYFVPTFQTFHMPSTRVLFHRLRPRSRKNCRKESLYSAHSFTPIHKVDLIPRFAQPYEPGLAHSIGVAKPRSPMCGHRTRRSLD